MVSFAGTEQVCDGCSKANVHDPSPKGCTGRLMQSETANFSIYAPLCHGIFNAVSRGSNE